MPKRWGNELAHDGIELNNHYDLLDIDQNASSAEIKKAFREKAKQLHPDIAGHTAAEAMRKLIAAYEILTDPQRRFEYDRAYDRFVRKKGFNYRTWLNEQDDPACQAKLVFFELLHLEEDRAVSIWQKNGGLDFKIENYMDREDWMDCLYILAEELDKRGYYFEAFMLMTKTLAEERKRPYFKIFTVEIENYLKSIINRLKPQVNAETWLDCMEIMMHLGFPAQDKLRWMRSITKTLEKIRA